MRIGIMAFGSDGEIQPHVELAIALAKRKHQVEIFIIALRNRDYSTLNKIEGITVVQVPYPNDKMAEAYPSKEFWNFSHSEFYYYFDSQFKLIRSHLRRYANKMVKSNDIVIGNRQVYPLRFSAEAAGIPYISLSFEHAFIKSGFYPPQTVEEGTYEENLEAWRKAEEFSNSMYLPEINEYRKLFNLPPAADYHSQVLYSNKLNLVSFSNHLFNNKIDWESNHKLCGYFNASHRNIDWEMPVSLEEFINAGEAPVCFTLGSLMEYESEPGHIHSLIADSVKKSGCRAIVLSDWAGGLQPGKNIFYTGGFVNYARLFPHCSLVVHHGGVGTLHCVAASGVPALIIAYGFDQFSNAKLLIQTGICRNLISRKELTAQKLAIAIKESLNDPQLAARSKELAKKIGSEDGLTEAVNTIENYFSILEKTHRIRIITEG